MACKHILTIKNEQGQDTESLLFNELYSLHNENEVLAMSEYAQTKTALFYKWADMNSDIELDSNGEPTLATLSRFLNESDSIDSSEELQEFPRAVVDPNEGDDSTIGGLKNKIESTSDISEVLSQSHPESNLINRIMNTASNNDWQFQYYGEEFDMGFMSKPEREAFILKKIIPLYKDFEKNLMPKMVDWLNSGADVKKIAQVFPTGTNRNRFDADVINGVLSMINYHPSDKYIRYSDIKGSKYESLGISHIQQFEGNNPIIAIHNSGPDQTATISVIDLTSLSVNKIGMDGKNKNLFSKFINNDQATNAGLNLANTEGGARFLSNGLLALALKDSNPNILIRRMASITMTPKNAYRMYIDVDRVIDNVVAISESPEMLSLFGADLQRIITDKKLRDLRHNYKENPINAYRNLLHATYNVEDGSETSLYSSTFIERDLANKLTNYLEGIDSKDNIKESLRARQDYMERNSQTDTAEYLSLSNAIIELDSVPTFEKGDIANSMSRTAMNFTNSFDIKDPVLQKIVSAIKNDHDFITGSMKDFSKEVDKTNDVFADSYYSNPMNRIAERLADTGGKRFAKLFKTSKDSKGNVIHTNEIHFDVNDPQTKEAIRKKQITEKEVLAGKWHVEQIKETFIQLLMHRSRFQDRMDSLDDQQKRNKAEAYYKAHWVDGQLPIISKSVNEMIMGGNIKDGFAKFWRQMIDQEQLFAEKVQPMKNSADTSVSNAFLTELDNKDFRLERMGLATENGLIVLKDASLNGNLSTNMETVSKYFKLAAIRKMRYEKSSLPLVNAARAVFASSKKATGKESEYLLAYLNEYADRIIHSKKQPSSFGKGYEFLDPLINTATAVTTFSGIAFSVPLAMTSFLMNNLKTMSTAFANSVAENGMFGLKEWESANRRFFHDSDFRNKALKVVEFYAFDAVGEKDIVGSRYSKVTKSFFSAEYAHGMNHWTDYYARAIVAAAQMEKDGSWDAHSIDKNGEMQYDQTKDKRFYTNGKVTEDGALKIDLIRSLLAQQGIMSPDQDKLVRGYDLSMARRIKTISDKYVIGGMDPTTSVAFKSYSGGNAIMQFKTYLPSIINNAFGSGGKSLDMGVIDIRINPATGKKEAYVRLQAFEGQAKAFMSLSKSFIENSYNLSKAWESMTPEQKHANSRLGMNLIMFAILYGLYNGLTKDWDDDDEAIVKDSRFLRVFKYGALDMISASPVALIRTFSSPIPAATNLGRIIEVVSGNSKDWQRSVPGSSAISPFAEIAEQISEDDNKSKR